MYCVNCGVELNPGAERCHRLFLNAADRQHAAAQRDLTGHGNTRADLLAGHRGKHRCCHRNARRRTILRHGTLRDM